MSKERICIKPEMGEGYVDSIVQVVSPFNLEKGMLLTVPVQFEATLIVNNGVEAKVESCDKLDLYHYIKKVYGLKKPAGCSVQLFFVLTKSFSDIGFGFGDIKVNNERLKEAYRIGANGVFSFEIENLKKLVYSFNMTKNVTSKMIHDKLNKIITSVGTDIISKYFANTETSIFEINASNSEIRQKMIDTLSTEKMISDLGIKISSLTLEPIYIREEDEKAIFDGKNKKGEDEDE